MNLSSPEAEKPDFIRFEGLSKRFGATAALVDVSFSIRQGETLGLLGSNGAGKSTLIKILSGLQPLTGGRILLDGQQVNLSSPVAARDLGIVTVHQNIDDGVIFGLTVAENLLLDELSEPKCRTWLPYRTIRKRAGAILDRLEIKLPLDALVETLPASARQEIAIARALVKKPRLLILDEPTSTLSAREAERLFVKMRILQQQDIAILYVSHHMNEIQLLCQRAVVLRNGHVVSNHVAPLDSQAITQSILGELALAPAFTPRPGRDIVLQAEGVRVSPHRPSLDLTVRRGEIVGLTGLVGAGKTELLEQFFGARPIVSGRLLLDGRPYAPRNQTEAIKSGVAMVPEERAAQSMFPGESVTMHASIGRLQHFNLAGLMRKPQELAFARRIIEDFRVRCPGPTAAIEALSGGNQQKLLVGRWLADARNLMILDEPFRGVDIGARGVIAAALRDYSEQTGVIICSSDPDEVIEVADRVLVLVDGHIVCDMKSSELTASRLTAIMSVDASASQMLN